MSGLSCEEKITQAIRGVVSLQAYFGSGPVRVFDRQLPPKYLESGACLQIMRVSTAPRPYSHTPITGTMLTLSEPRIQFTVRAWAGVNNKFLPDAPHVARQAKAALILWLSTVSFAADGITVGNAPNFVLNERSGVDPQLDPPGWIEQFDVRVMNIED